MGSGCKVKFRRTGVSGTSVTCLETGMKPSLVATMTRNCSVGRPWKPKKPSPVVVNDALVSMTFTVAPSSGRRVGSKT